VICERLWDVARLAFVDYAHATNAPAQRWFEEHPRFALPVDPRPLRDRRPPPNVSIVRHTLRAARSASHDEQPNAEILFIGSDTPTPELPVRRKATPLEGVLYIGDDGTVRRPGT
jgi:hypothetical protein